MTFLNMTSTTKLPAILRRAFSEARKPTQATDALLGSTDEDVREELVSMANECQRDFFDRFATLNQTSGTINITAGNIYSDLPSDLRDSDILEIRWDDGELAGRGVPLRTASDVCLMRQGTDGDYTCGGYPAFAYLPPESPGKLAWHGVPGVTATATVRYRVLEKQFVLADADKGTATTVCDIPDRLIPILSLLIAIEINDRYEGGGSTTNALLRAKLEDKVFEWQKKLSQFAGSSTNEVLEYGGMPAGFEDIGVYHYNDLL